MEACDNCHTGAILYDAGKMRLCQRCYPDYLELENFGLTDEQIEKASKIVKLSAIVSWARSGILNPKGKSIKERMEELNDHGEFSGHSKLSSESGRAGMDRTILSSRR